jgi:putative phage-type endonuclease
MFKIDSGTDREAWLALRQNLVTATDVTVLIGSNPFKTKAELWLEKQGESTFTGNARTRIGQVLEGSLLDYASAELPGTVEPGALYGHVDYPWCAATPDGLHWLDGELPAAVVECKTTTAWVDPPRYVLDQVQWQMFVTGATRGEIVRLFGLDALDIFTVDYDATRVAELFAVAHEFYTDHLLTGEGPDVEPLSVLEAADELVSEYASVSSQVKHLEQVKRGLRDEILFLMGGAVLASAGDYKVKVSEYEKVSVNLERLRDEYPDIANECSVVSKVTTLRVS